MLNISGISKMNRVDITDNNNNNNNNNNKRQFIRHSNMARVTSS